MGVREGEKEKEAGPTDLYSMGTAVSRHKWLRSDFCGASDIHLALEARRRR